MSPIDTTPATVLSAVVAGDGISVTVVMSEPVTGTTGWSLAQDVSNMHLSLTLVSGATITFSCDTVTGGIDNVTITYSPGNFVDLKSIAIRPVSGLRVINNSAQ